jgi:hypothetical protein
MPVFQTNRRDVCFRRPLLRLTQSLPMTAPLSRDCQLGAAVAATPQRSAVTGSQAFEIQT